MARQFRRRHDVPSHKPQENIHAEKTQRTKIEKREEVLRNTKTADKIEVFELNLDATFRVALALWRRVLNCDDQVEMASMFDQCRQHRDQHRM